MAASGLGVCSRLPQEFQEVSDPLLLLPPRTAFGIFSPVPRETCQCYHLADGEMMARSLVFGFSFCLLSSEKCPPGCLTEPTADSEVLFGTAESPETHA